MQLIAQFSPTTPLVARGFWPDVEQTEEWLQSLNKKVASRILSLGSKSMALLDPWIPLLRSPMEVVGWLDPMEVQLTWQYLLHFLAASGPDSIVIPFGGDAAVTWQPGSITIRALRDTWIWALAVDSWDPAGWHLTDRVEWWEHGRLQQAARTQWGLFEQWQHPYGMEEWRLSANPGTHGQLMGWWEQLAHRLGSRPLKVSWRQEHSHDPHNILGLPVRVTWLGLKISADQADFWTALPQWSEPFGLRAAMHWSSPHWNEFWGTNVTLKRWRQSTRLEAQYTLLKGSLHKNAIKMMRQEMHRFPIFRVQPVGAGHTPDNTHSWGSLVRRAGAAEFKENLAAKLTQYPWPTPRDFSAPARIRLPQGWVLDRLSSRPGVWSLRHRGLELAVQVFWPRAYHAGGVTVTIGSQVNASLFDLDPRARIDRFSPDRRYWAYVVAEHILPALSQS